MGDLPCAYSSSMDCDKSEEEPRIGKKGIVEMGKTEAWYEAQLWTPVSPDITSGWKSVPALKAPGK